MFFISMMPPGVIEWLEGLGHKFDGVGDWAVIAWIKGLYTEHLAQYVDAIPFSEIGMTGLLIFLAVGFMNDAAGGKM